MLRLAALSVTVHAVVSLAAPAEEPPPVRTNAVSVRLAGGLSLPSPGATLGGLGGLYVASPSAPDVAVAYEHAFGNLSLTLSLGGGMTSSSLTRNVLADGPGFQQAFVTIEPGVRYGLRGPLSGPWLGGAVALSTGGITSGAGTLVPTTFGVGVEALAGWTFQFESGLLLQGGVGPRVAYQQTRLAAVLVEGVPATSSVASLGLRAFVNVGAAF